MSYFSITVPIVGYAQVEICTDDYEGMDDDTTIGDVIEMAKNNELDIEFSTRELVQWNCISFDERLPDEFERRYDMPVEIEITKYD